MPDSGIYPGNAGWPCRLGQLGAVSWAEAAGCWLSPNTSLTQRPCPQLWSSGPLTGHPQEPGPWARGLCYRKPLPASSTLRVSWPHTHLKEGCFLQQDGSASYNWMSEEFGDGQGH